MIPAIGSWRRDVVMIAAEDIAEAGLVLRQMRRPVSGVKVLRTRKDRVAGVSIHPAKKGERIWVRTGACEVQCG